MRLIFMLMRAKIENPEGFNLLLLLIILKSALMKIFEMKKSFKLIFENKSRFNTFAFAFGLVAQLNRAPDYGSGGFRFES